MMFKLPLFLFILLLSGFKGCFDSSSSNHNPNNAPIQPVYQSPTRFINGITDVPGPVTILVDGVSQGTMTLGGTLAYRNLPAGLREMKVQGDTTTGMNTYTTLNTDTDYSILIVNGANSQFHSILHLVDFFVYGVEADTAKVRFINLSPDTTVGIWRITGTDTVQLVPSLASGGNSAGYFQVPTSPKVNEFILTNSTGTLVQVRTSTKKITAPPIDPRRRKTIYFFNTKVNLQIGQLTDN